MLPHLSTVPDDTGTLSFNHVLWRRRNFGGQDSDGGGGLDAGGSRTSLGGGFCVWGLPGTSLQSSASRLFCPLEN